MIITTTRQLVYAVIALVCVSAGILFFFNKKSYSKVQDTLVLGTMSGWPPYVTINAQGEHEGLDIDIAKKIAQKLNKRLVIKDMDTAALIIALEKHTVDFIMTGLSITQERLEKIAMIPYQGEPITELPLVFWQKVPAGVTTLSDLARMPNARICVEAGSSQEEILKKHSGFTISYTDPLTSVLEIKQGKATASLLETTLYKRLKHNYPELVALMVPLNPNEIIMGNGIGVNKHNKELIQAITRIINELKQDNFIATSEQHWINKPA